jgi:hypothetical protein
MLRMHVHPPPCASPPPQPERLVVRKGSGQQEKIIKIFLKSIKFFSVQKNRKIKGGG